jgi:hypothetical protein
MKREGLTERGARIKAGKRIHIGKREVETSPGYFEFPYIIEVWDEEDGWIESIETWKSIHEVMKDAEKIGAALARRMMQS